MPSSALTKKSLALLCLYHPYNQFYIPFTSSFSLPFTKLNKLISYSLSLGLQAPGHLYWPLLHLLQFLHILLELRAVKLDTALQV